MFKRERDARAEQLDALKREIESVSTRIAELNRGGDRMIALSTTILAALVSAALSFQILWGLVATPLVILVLGAFGTFTLGELHSLAGYQAALERQANRTLGRNVYLWESRLVKFRTKDFSSKVLPIAALTVNVVVGAVAIWAAVQLAVGLWLPIAVGVVWAVAVAVPIIGSLRSGARQRREFFDRAAGLLGQRSPRAK